MSGTNIMDPSQSYSSRMTVLVDKGRSGRIMFFQINIYYSNTFLNETLAIIDYLPVNPHVILMCNFLIFLCLPVTVGMWNISLELMSFNIWSLVDSVVLGSSGTFTHRDVIWEPTLSCIGIELDPFGPSLDLSWSPSNSRLLCVPFGHGVCVTSWELWCCWCWKARFPAWSPSVTDSFLKHSLLPKDGPGGGNVILEG